MILLSKLSKLMMKDLKQEILIHDLTENNNEDEQIYFICK